MGLIKWIVIIAIILLILGLYYYTDETKDFLKIAGKTTMDITGKAVDTGGEFIEEGGLDKVENKIKEAAGS